MAFGYRFPNGDVLTRGSEIFARILETKESATATEETTGSHAGRTLTYEEVYELCHRPLKVNHG